MGIIFPLGGPRQDVNICVWFLELNSQMMLIAMIIVTVYLYFMKLNICCLTLLSACEMGIVPILQTERV